MSEILLQYTRGGKVESIHRGDVAAVDVTGRLLWAIGEANRQMFWRSSAKPFQLLPFIERGGIATFGITQEEIALMVASHSGEAQHVAVLQRILSKIGVTSADLTCGAVKPGDSRTAKELIRNNQPYQAMHNPCSGKHTGMLALAQILKAPLEGYHKMSHPVQQLMLESIANSTLLTSDKVETGIDGCGVPVFYLPLFNMAMAYARLVRPEHGRWGAASQEGVRIIRDAMVAYPQMVGGSRQFDTVLMTITQGRILAKIGAEAVYCMASIPDGIGVAFKIEDGSLRSIPNVAIGILKKLALISDSEYVALRAQFPAILKNHCGDVIGTIETEF
jgi:L-asparaginase II